MKIYDDIFDKRFLDEFTNKLRYTNWYATNIANRSTWPYGEKGTHRLLGDVLFARINVDKIQYSKDKDLSFETIDMFYAIRKTVQRKMVLQQIATNLQFMGMDGTNHIDTLNPDTEEYSYVLMLSDDHVSGEEGGEFINETVGQTVPYRYGRTIEFKTSDKHRGLAFKTPHKARYSVKFVGKVIE
tara:strand:+ start:99 stop:653 length:555 start_codon:yes stop_codon:yes gene_type:complete